MRRLVDHIHITTHLAILDHGEAVYVEKVEAPGFIKMNTWIGRRMEVHSTAVGKALLAYLDAQGARRHPSPARPEEADSPHHHHVPKLMKEFERVRQSGLCRGRRGKQPGSPLRGRAHLQQRGHESRLP